MIRIPLHTTVVVALCSTAAAQNGADECAAADVLAAGPGAFAFDTSNCSDTSAPATSGTLSQCLTISDDVWFVWTAADTGQHTVSTCGAANFDTELAVWLNPDGDGDCDNLVPIGCNDDGLGCAGFTSELSLALTAGEEYFIQLGDANLIDGDNNGQGTLTITLDNPPPANDTCASPEALVGTGAFPYDTGAATTSGFTGGGCAVNVNQDVFFSWTAPMAGDYRIDTCQTSYDTRLSVHAGTGCAATCFAEDDDSCALQSVVDLVGLAGGETFLIQVGGFGGEAGPGTLSIGGILPTGGDCSDPIDLGNAPGSFAYDTTGATSSGFNPLGCMFVNQDMFFTWTAPSAGDWVIGTCMTSYDTKLAVHDGADCAATCLASADDNCGTAQGSVTVTLAAGQTVLIQVGGFGALSGPGTLEIEEYVDPCDLAPDDGLEENDDCASAVPVPVGKAVGLFVHQTDPDWYVVTVPQLSTAYIQAIFPHDEGDIDLHLFDVCGGTQLGQSISTTDNEQVFFDNATAAPVDVLVLVEMSALDDELCNDYDLVVSAESGMPGQTYCPATPNSTGFIAQITGSGTSSLSANDLTLIANPVPNNVPGLFINSANQAQIPFGSKIRCVAKPFRRSRIMRAQGSVLTIRIDNMRIPEATQGASRFFQAWFRDNQDPDFFGLSNGYAVVFRE